MADNCDILVAGTGTFGARIIFDIAVTAEKPVKVAIGGRNRSRMDWLCLAANARAAIFGRPASFSTLPIEWESAETVAEAIAASDPDVVVQAASVQSPSVIHTTDTAWGQLVKNGGLSVTAVFQALLSERAARAMLLTGNRGAFINCCYPDVVNGLLAAKKVPITCGVGNVAILSTMFEGDLGIRQSGSLKVLAHYQCLGPWRLPAAERGGTPARVWIDDKEIDDLYPRFAHLKLTPEPVIDISGCTTVPIVYALLGHRDLLGHAPAPEGLPGGYPVAVKDRVMTLDLPAGLGRDDAVAWNRAFEEESGLLVEDDGRVVYCGTMRSEFAKLSPALAEGFHVDDLETVYDAMVELRAKLGG